MQETASTVAEEFEARSRRSFSTRALATIRKFCARKPLGAIGFALLMMMSNHLDEKKGRNLGERALDSVCRST